uniref:F-box domain-containing protein n=1 Tax=Strongyloides venezuelensis TaxID=75913 RepID=A0A0K0EWE3_STRVS
MDLNLLSLPPEILAKIFSNIPWNQLNNVKLTTKKFNYVTEKYLKDMQKPKLYEIIFEDDYTDNDGTERINVAYGILNAGEDVYKNTSHLKQFFLFPLELYKVHSFLRKVDLTSLSYVTIFLYNHTEIIRVFNDYFYNTNRIKSIDVTIRSYDKDHGNTLSFLQKIQNVENLLLDLNFSHLNVPRDFVIPVRNSLKSIVIRKSRNMTFINKRMIKYIVENNPDLEEYKLSLNDFKTYKMAIKTIVKEELSRGNNGCFHKRISIDLGIFSDGARSELLRYFYSVEFPYNGTNIQSRSHIYKGKLECFVCGKFDSIKIFEDEI